MGREIGVGPGEKGSVAKVGGYDVNGGRGLCEEV